METQAKSGAKDFFINLGAIVALYTTVVSLVNLLFRVINKAYPKINEGYSFLWSSESISWPVAAIIVFFPVFILLMWLLEQDYKASPDKQYAPMHKWFAFITIFFFGLVLAGDLLTILYYFIDGRELTTGFFLKVLVLLVIAGGILSYYMYDVLGKLTGKIRNIYRAIALVIVLGSIAWGFSVLGSPYTQRLYKYDEQKINNLMSTSYAVENYYQVKGVLPQALEALSIENDPTYYDPQTNKPYGYEYVNETTYKLCAEFNKDSFGTAANKPYYPDNLWNHPAGYYCFEQTVNKDNIYYPDIRPMPIY